MAIIETLNIDPLMLPSCSSRSVKTPHFWSGRQTFHMYTWNHTRLFLIILSHKKPARTMKQLLLWLDICVGEGVRFGEVCSRSHSQFYLELIKLTRALGLMQHAANSRVNCKTVRADEDGVSLRRNQILWVHTMKSQRSKEIRRSRRGSGKGGLVGTPEI